MGKPIWEVHDLKEDEYRIFLPEFSATKIVTWKCHVDEFTDSRYDMILGRDLPTALGLDLKFSENVKIGGEGPYEGCPSTMVDVRNYNFKSIKDKTVKPEESFVNSYVDECFEYFNAIKSIRRMRIISYAKHEKTDLNEFMTKKRQQNLTATEHHRLLQLLKKFEDLFDGTLDTWNTTLVDLELKDNTKPV